MKLSRTVKILSTSTFFNVRNELTFQLIIGNGEEYVEYVFILDGDDTTPGYKEKLIKLCVLLNCNLNGFAGKELHFELDPKLSLFQNITKFFDNL